MRYLDMQTWPRREHFKVFGAFDHPHFGMVANLDITAFHAAVKQRGFSITIAIVYVIARAANSIPEFRYRLRPEGVVEHEIVHPSFTVLVDEDTFTFCNCEYNQDFKAFTETVVKQIAFVKANPSLKDKSQRDDMLFMTAIPWVSFTSFMHPMHLNPADSVPRFAWGKFFEEGRSLKMPLGVQVHHALMDGLHVGRYYAEVERCFNHPEIWLPKE
jgi:chloramphenicol O-acetyltransferase type A